MRRPGIAWLNPQSICDCTTISGMIQLPQSTRGSPLAQVSETLGNRAGFIISGTVRTGTFPLAPWPRGGAQSCHENNETRHSGSSASGRFHLGRLLRHRAPRHQTHPAHRLQRSGAPLHLHRERPVLLGLGMRMNRSARWTLGGIAASVVFIGAVLTHSPELSFASAAVGMICGFCSDR